MSGGSPFRMEHSIAGQPEWKYDPILRFLVPPITKSKAKCPAQLRVALYS